MVNIDENNKTPRRRISRSYLAENIIPKLRKASCWRMGKYLGSMLYFDFGGVKTIKRKKRSDVECGEITLGIRDVYWVIKRGGKVVIDSDNISDADIAALSSEFRGAHIDNIFQYRACATIDFSNGVSIDIDAENKYDTRSAIYELIVGNEIIYTSPRGYIYCIERVIG